MITEKQRHDRHVIEHIWRKVYGHGDNVELAGSDKEWEFMEALLNAQSGIPHQLPVSEYSANPFNWETANDEYR